MKTLLIPALALTLASLPAPAQKTAEPAAPIPPPAVATSTVTVASSALMRKVQFNDAALGEVISYLNEKLAEQNGEPLNVVVSAGLESTKVPTILLQNVTATDVLNVVAKLIDLTVEPVPSESGKVAAWIITKRRTFNAVRGGNATLGLGASGSGMPGGSEVGLQPTRGIPRTGFAPGLPPNSPIPLNPPDVVPGPEGAPNPLAKWLDPAGLAPAPAPEQISRVIGIGKIYADSATPDERAKKEDELADRLTNIAKNEGMECKVTYYGNLQVIVLKGTPEGVAFIEQTVAAMKENAGGRKSGGNSLPGGF